MKRQKEIFLWEVYILPNNQPKIKLGEYYAPTSKAAIEQAAVDNETSSDECWGARLKK